MSNPEYSQGICGDGASILKDGQPMTIEEIVAELRGNAQPSAEPVATINEAGFSLEDARRVMALPPGTKLYAQPTDSAALRDAERMEWLEKMASDPGGLLLHDGSVKPPRLGLGLRPGSVRRTLREAIDTAMAQHGGQQND